MKSIEANFKTIQSRNPSWSSFICFVETIRNGRFYSWKNIVSWFNKLINTDDYSKADKKTILAWLQTTAFSKSA